MWKAHLIHLILPFHLFHEVLVKMIFGWNHVGKAHSYIWFGAENTELTKMK